MSGRGNRPEARDRILAAAVGQIAREGLEGARIARIAMEAGVSTALVHYHFASRESLLAEALEYSYTRAADGRLGSEADQLTGSHAERLAAMIDVSLPVTDSLREDWVLWMELWLQTARGEALRPYAQELYARLHAWFAEEVAAGVSSGEFAPCDPDEVADRTLALLDGLGIRAMMGDAQMPLERARHTARAALAGELGLGEQLVRDPAGAEESSRQAEQARGVKSHLTRAAGSE